jgi:hypothetical protein
LQKKIKKKIKGSINNALQESMGMTIELYETMCAYFDGKLTLEEEKRFLEKIDSDPELRKEFEWEERLIYKLAQEAKVVDIGGGIVSDGWSVNDTAVKENPVWKPGPIQLAILHIKQHFVFRRYKWAIAAAVAGLIVTSVYLIRQKPTGENVEWVNWDWHLPKIKPIIPDTPGQDPNKLREINERLMAKARKEKQWRIITKFGRHVPDPVTEPVEVSKIQEDYVMNKHEENLVTTSKPIISRGGEADKEKINAYAAFYRGLSFLELNKDSAAIRTLAALLPKKDQFPELVLEARWNMSKAYYKNGDKKTALAILNELLTTDGFMFKADAKKLIQMIKADKG